MTAQQKTRVVVADDSALSRRVLGDLVTSSIDMELVATASNGEQAVQAVQKHRPDVLLMDVLMPVVDGLGATEILMSESPLPIVLVSELVGLRMEETDLRQGLVRVTGKGGRQRLVPLGEEAVAWLERYLAEARGAVLGSRASDVVFPTARGGAMTRQAFWQLVKRYAARAIPASSRSK